MVRIHLAQLNQDLIYKEISFVWQLFIFKGQGIHQTFKINSSLIEYNKNGLEIILGISLITLEIRMIKHKQLKLHVLYFQATK